MSRDIRVVGRPFSDRAAMWDDLYAIGFTIYVFCTDFVINTANLLGVTYQDVNAGLFFILWPAVTLGLVLLVSWQQIVLWRLAVNSRAASARSR